MGAHVCVRSTERTAAKARALVGILYSIAGIVGMTGAAAVAQDAGPPTTAGTPANASGLEEVVVTGSRIERSTFNTPNPVTVLGA